MPLPLTISCSSKSRLVLPSWFHLSGACSPRWSRTKSKRAVKRLCVCERDGSTTCGLWRLGRILLANGIRRTEMHHQSKFIQIGWCVVKTGLQWFHDYSIWLQLTIWSAKLRSAFYPYVRTYGPQILVCVLPADGPQIRTSAFYTLPNSQPNVQTEQRT